MSQPIVPPNHGLTPEAREALREQGIDVGSQEDEDEPLDVGELPDLESAAFRSMIATEAAPSVESTGDAIVVGEIVTDDGTVPKDRPSGRTRGTSSRAASSTSRDEPRTDPKAGPPSLDEWQKFFSRVVLKVFINWYLDFAFRGIPEDALNERELERLVMTEDERNAVAVPFAELSHKSKLMRKYGRTIVASGGAFEAMVTLGAWMRRVNKIAAAHRPKQQRATNVRTQANGNSGQGSQESNGTQGAYGGRIPEWFSGPIFPSSG